jgi:hypothetical protein
MGFIWAAVQSRSRLWTAYFPHWERYSSGFHKTNGTAGGEVIDADD